MRTSGKYESSVKTFHGNEIFAGLTLEESMRFNFLSESLLGQQHRSQDDVDEYRAGLLVDGSPIPLRRSDSLLGGEFELGCHQLH